MVIVLFLIIKFVSFYRPSDRDATHMDAFLMRMAIKNMRCAQRIELGEQLMRASRSVR